jgi:hypothetical protein
MPTLTVTMLIEFDRQLVFYQWIPDGEHDAIVFDDTGITLRIWFDVQCATWVRSGNARLFPVRMRAQA